MKAIMRRFLLLPVLISSSEIIVVFNISLRIKDFGGDEFTVALAPTLASIMQIIFSMFSGSLSDRYGRRRILFSGIVIYIIAFIGLVLSPTFYLIICFAGFLGAAGAFFWPPVMAFIADESSEGALQRNLSALNICWAGGAFAGLFLAGYIREASVHTVKALPFLSALFLVLAAMVYGKIFVNIGGKREMEASKKIEPLSRAQQTNLIFGFIVIAGTIFNISIILWLFPKFAGDIDISYGTAGIIVAMIPLAEMLMYFLLGRFNPDYNSSFYLTVFIILNLVVCAVLSIASNAVVLGGAMFLMGIALGGCWSFSQYHTVLHPHLRGVRSGVLQMLMVTGSLGGSFFGGLSARMTGSNRAPFILAMVVAAFLVVALLFIKIAFGMNNKNSE